jgi:predicted nucleic acid-binding Zn ribbon protein
MSDDTNSPAPDEQPELKGVDLARRALEDARAAAKASGKSVGQGRSSPTGGVRALRGRRRRGWSGAGPDDRDPQAFGALANSIASKRGWSAKVSEGAVLGRWPSVVGEDISAHADPTGLKDGVLSISAESTAWATQLRLMQSQGHGVVTSLRITGPTTQSWRKGERHVKGRGPRDTYG